MSIKNEDVVMKVKQHFKNLETYLNLTEEELTKEEVDLSQSRTNIALNIGKMIKSYEEMVFLLDIYSEDPKIKG